MDAVGTDEDVAVRLRTVGEVGGHAVRSALVAVERLAEPDVEAGEQDLAQGRAVDVGVTGQAGGRGPDDVVVLVAGRQPPDHRQVGAEDRRARLGAVRGRREDRPQVGRQVAGPGGPTPARTLPRRPDYLPGRDFRASDSRPAPCGP
jgi:hypothetical protein